MKPREDLRAQRIEALQGDLRTAAVHDETGGAPDEARTAVVVVHGMGQQLTFQTLDDVVWGVLREHERRTQIAPGQQPSKVGILHAGPECGHGADRLVPRATLTLRDDQDRPRAVDAFECYWAPLTQGAVGIRDVMGFLWDAGLNGLRNSGGVFRRTMFGRVVAFPGQRRTAQWLLLALLVIAALLLFNAAVALVIGVKLLGQGASAWMGEAFIGDATWLFLLTVGGLLASLMLMWVLRSMVFFFLSLGVVLAGAGLLLAAALAHRLGWWTEPLFGEPLAAWWAYGTWVVLLVISWKARGLLVQYVGDVAAYVQPHKLGRFSDLRAAIKSEARAVAEVVYGLRQPGGTGPRYERVAIVAHSLGSVVAYDMLNDLLVRDLARGEPLDVAGRTRLLLTFGSPLDKIEFCFRAQGTQTGSTRENLVAARQPLIRDYAWRRRLAWINVHHPKDIISGPLDYFDDPEDTAHAARHVRNLVDPHGRTPLAAHVEYWSGALVFQVLYDALIES